MNHIDEIYVISSTCDFCLHILKKKEEEKKQTFTYVGKRTTTKTTTQIEK